MTKQLHLLAAFTMLCLASAPIAGAAVLDGWPMFHGDGQHSGFTTSSAPYDSMLAWNYVTSDSISFSSPVVAHDGTIYIGNLDGELLAISALGELQWRFRAANNFRHATPAIGLGGVIYIGDAGGNFYAINPDSTLRWTRSFGAPIKTSAAIGPDGAIYFGCDNGDLYALNPDRTVRWTYPAGDTIRSSPAIAPDGTILFGCLDNYLYALWPDGTLRWRAATGAPIKYAAPAVSADNVVYCGSYDGFLYAVTTSQTFLWAYPTSHVIRSTPAIGPDGSIYVCSGNKLICLTAGGEFVWDYDTGGEIYSSPVCFGSDMDICVGSDDGVLHCVHSDGSGDWTYTVGARIRSVPSPGAFGRVYAADVSGAIWAFGPTDVSVDEIPGIARGDIYFASPNPFTESVAFQFSGAAVPPPLAIYDAAGRQVVTITANGHSRLDWDGRDGYGSLLPAGIYFYRPLSGGVARRLALLR